MTEGIQVDSEHPQGLVPQNSDQDPGPELWRLDSDLGGEAKDRSQVMPGRWQLGPSYSPTRDTEAEARSPTHLFMHQEQFIMRLILGPRIP